MLKCNLIYVWPTYIKGRHLRVFLKTWFSIFQIISSQCSVIQKLNILDIKYSTDSIFLIFGIPHIQYTWYSVPRIFNTIGIQYSTDSTTVMFSILQIQYSLFSANIRNIDVGIMHMIYVFIYYTLTKSKCTI